MRLFLPRPGSTWLVTSVLAISFVSVYQRAYVLHGESGSGVGSPMFQFPRLHSTLEQRAARADTRASVCTTLAERGMRSTGAFPFRPPFARFSSSSRPTSRPESRERERERDVRVKSSNGAISRTVDAEGAFEEKCVHFVKTSRTKKFIFERMDFSNRCDRSVSASVGRVVLSRCKLVHVSYIRMLCYGKRDELRANAYRVS